MSRITSSFTVLHRSTGKCSMFFYQLRIPRIDAGRLFFHIRIGNRIDRVKLIWISFVFSEVAGLNCSSCAASQQRDACYSLILRGSLAITCKWHRGQNYWISKRMVKLRQCLVEDWHRSRTLLNLLGNFIHSPTFWKRSSSTPCFTSCFHFRSYLLILRYNPRQLSRNETPLLQILKRLCAWNHCFWVNSPLTQVRQ